MKKILLVAALSLTVFSACKTSSKMSGTQHVTVDTEKKLNTDFSKYKTYAWASQVDNKLDPGFYFLNDLELKARIRDAVKYEMDARAYTFQRQSPDLIVNFRVFEKPTKIQGYTGYGTTYFGNEVREPEDATTFDVKAGSIVVNLVDEKTGQVVWRGLISGLTNDNGFDRSQNKIKESINLIFEKYPFRGDKITENR